MCAHHLRVKDAVRNWAKLLRESEENDQNLWKRRNEKESVILFTYAIRKQYKNMIMTVWV